MRIVLLTTGCLALLAVVILLNLRDNPSTDSSGSAASTSTSDAPASDSDASPEPQAPQASTNPSSQTAAANKPAEPIPDPLPEPIATAHQSPPSHISLWQPDQNQPDAEVEGIPVKRLQTSPADLNQLHVGQQIELAIPQLDKTVEARIETTKNQLNTVQVFKGPLIDGHKKDNVIITRGKTQTHVVIATREGVFSAVIDNATGKTTLTDEGEIHERTSGEDDSVPLEGMEMPVPSTTNDTTNKNRGHS